MDLLYALNIDYLKGLKYTFEVIQRFIMNLGIDSCSARVHGLRNKLLQLSHPHQFHLSSLLSPTPPGVTCFPQCIYPRVSCLSVPVRPV
uniref:Uncharacterized protein n=1 Tax=Salmo trutta TaxID=8032 RepID=A0A673WNZ2_SALTR